MEIKSRAYCIMVLQIIKLLLMKYEKAQKSSAFQMPIRFDQTYDQTC